MGLAILHLITHSIGLSLHSGLLVQALYSTINAAKLLLEKRELFRLIIIKLL